MVTINSRKSIALILTTVYLTIVLGSLAPLALHSPVVAHALTGECAEDCRICGCSPERSASHTCCCWQKKLRREKLEAQEQPMADCCTKNKKRTSEVSISECPCGSGKFLAFTSSDRDELLPYHFNGSIIILQEPVRFARVSPCLTDRHIPPPDPPPKTSPLS